MRNHMNIDPDKMKAFNAYLDDVLADRAGEPHPFTKFMGNEIVVHPAWGTGIVTGYRIPDAEREFEGLGVQFVVHGRMTAHRVFTPGESRILRGSGRVYDIAAHAGRTLEDILESGRDN